MHQTIKNRGGKASGPARASSVSRLGVLAGCAAIVLGAGLGAGPSVVLSGSPPGAGAGESQADAQDVSDQLRDLVDETNIPCMAAVVVRGRDVIARGAVGVRKIGDPTQVSAYDQFHLGSCTKAMTATLCAMLIEEGKLRWDTTIGEMYPELAPSMTQGWAGITLEQLLTQTAGACKELHKDNLWGILWNHTGTPTEARLDMLRTIVKWDLDHVPGTKYEYANTNFIIAGMMAEKAAGVAYEELITKKLFEPLGMTSAGFGAPGTSGAVDQPWGTGRDGKSMAPARNADNPPMLSPAGRAHMSLDDWAKFVSLHLEGERPETARLLKPETFKKLHTPALNNYACGWMVASRPWAGPAKRAITHNGSNTMWYATTWLAPEKSMAVLVATNSARDGVAGVCDQAAYRLIQKYIADQPPITPAGDTPK